MGMPAATTAARHLARTSLHRRCSDGASTPCCEKDAVPKMELRESQRGDWGRTWLHPSRPWRQTGAGPRGSSGAGSSAQAAIALTQPTRSGRSRSNRSIDSLDRCGPSSRRRGDDRLQRGHWAQPHIARRHTSNRSRRKRGHFPGSQLQTPPSPALRLPCSDSPHHHRLASNGWCAGGCGTARGRRRTRPGYSFHRSLRRVTH